MMAMPIYEDIRLAGERHGDHDALAHAARMLERILLHAALRLVDVDEAEHLDRAVPGLLAVAVGVEHDGLHELVTDGVGRVQAGHRVLKDDGNFVAADGLHDLFARADELLPVELDGAADDLAGRRQNLHDAVGRDALARAGLAHNAEHLAALEIERNAVDGLDLARVREEGGAQVVDF